MRVVQRLPRERQLEGNLQAAPVKGGVSRSIYAPRDKRPAQGGCVTYFLQGTTIANFKIEIFDSCNLYERLSPILI